MREDGTEIDLTPAEFAIIWILAKADGRVLTRKDLVDAISSGDGPLSFRAVDILISRLRKKLDKGVYSECIDILLRLLNGHHPRLTG